MFCRGKGTTNEYAKPILHLIYKEKIKKFKFRKLIDNLLLGI